MTLLALDSTAPLVWRSATSVQWGTDPVLCRIDGVGAPEERMMHALESGVSSSGLPVLAAKFGLGEARFGDLLQRLEPVLVTVGDRTTPCTVLVHSAAARVQPPSAAFSLSPRSGSGSTGQTGVHDRMPARIEPDRPGAALVAAALPPDIIVVNWCRPSAPPDLAVVIGGYVVHDNDVAPWMGADVPHLLVRFTESSGLVGPLVRPGETSCLSCSERWQSDADPEHPTLQGQLRMMDPSAAAGPALLQSVALTARVVSEWCGGDATVQRPSPSGTVTLPPVSLVDAVTNGVLRVDAATGEVTRRPAPSHPECGCRDP